IGKEIKADNRELLDSNSPITLLSVNCSVQYLLQTIPYFFLVVTFCTVPSANVFAQTNVSIANIFTLNQSFDAFSIADNNIETNFSKTFTLTPKTARECYLSQISNRKNRGATNFNVLWTPSNSGSKGLGLTQLDLSTTFSVLLPNPVSPFLITPSFQTTFFDPKMNGYTTNKTLYATGIDFRWIKPVIHNKLTFDLGCTVQYGGDFKVKGDKSLRFPSRFMSIWNCKPHLKMILGLAYLDRDDDFNWLPVAGVIWEPHEDISVELVIPHARIAQRIHWFDSAVENDTSDWLYVAFEFGSGSWKSKYQGTAANIDYRDLKLLFGGERRCASGMTLGLEIGYMFERKYESTQPNYCTYPADCVFLKLRTSF
ncbi:MAG: hypothetical protein LBF88_09845, partial [Planctomycetaceae bacterium]|nr:hypothetical protein [Planctomycetaceae bacterium]